MLHSCKCELKFATLLLELKVWNLVIVKGDVAGSVAEFDKAIELDPRQKACKLM